MHYIYKGNRRRPLLLTHFYKAKIIRVNQGKTLGKHFYKGKHFL